MLRANSAVSARLDGEALAKLFDLDYHVRHTGTIFARVFGEGARG